MNASCLMWTTILKLPTPFQRGNDRYEVLVEGLEREDGTWEGRITFRGAAELRRTSRETTQPDRPSLEYWATGLEQIYLDGAFDRAQ